jgi:hypothetical protein
VSQPEGDYRPMSAWSGLRTVCHGCRTMHQVVERTEDNRFESRTMIVPGNGTVLRTVAASWGEAVVEEPCPVCGEFDSPGWIPGFQPPA